MKAVVREDKESEESTVGRTGENRCVLSQQRKVRQ